MAVPPKDSDDGSETVVVTGASRGLGRHLCGRLVGAGYKVIGIARTVDPLPGVRMLACDVGNADAVRDAFAEIKKSDTFYSLINAAGIASMNLVLLMPPETIEMIVRINLLGTIYCSQQAGRLLARRRRGRIINFSTIAVSLALKGEAAYAASKAGVETFSRTFAREMGDHEVTVNCIAPGPIDTALIAKVSPEKIDRIIARQAINRKATPEDVWDIVSMLLSPQAAMVTGDVLHIGGA